MIGVGLYAGAAVVVTTNAITLKMLIYTPYETVHNSPQAPEKTE